MYEKQNGVIDCRETEAEIQSEEKGWHEKRKAFCGDVALEQLLVYVFVSGSDGICGRAGFEFQGLYFGGCG